MTPPDPAGDSRWAEVLAAMAADLDRAEGVLSSADPAVAAPWPLPHGLGTLPARLVPLARAVLARQGTVAHRVRGALDRNRAQQRLADRVDAATTARATPVYLDVDA